jgi:ABC-type transporter Mla maintaining outer membrane lipid asymmetry ATPase subunit MlaF
MNEPAIIFENVRAPMSGNVHSLDVDLRIASGECIACVGPSRSGKSLLIELAAGLVAPESGRVIILGQDWNDGPDDVLSSVRLRVGPVLQQPGLLSNMTLFNNVLLPLRYHRGTLSDRHREQAVMAQLERLGLVPMRDRFPAELNQGEVRRAAIARALILDPDILLLDDPLAGLDADMVLALQGYIEEYRTRRSPTVVAALRASSPFLQAADRLVVLREGRVEGDGIRAAVLDAIPVELKRYVE